MSKSLSDSCELHLPHFLGYIWTRIESTWFICQGIKLVTWVVYSWQLSSAWRCTWNLKLYCIWSCALFGWWNGTFSKSVQLRHDEKVKTPNFNSPPCQMCNKSPFCQPQSCPQATPLALKQQKWKNEPGWNLNRLALQGKDTRLFKLHIILWKEMDEVNIIIDYFQPGANDQYFIFQQ